jgi:hypothetical protein
MVTVRTRTALPIGADEAFALALKPATFAYVARGVMRVPALEAIPGDFAAPGAKAGGRMWWLGVIPSWTHHLRIVAIEAPARTIQTAERGGPLRTWNHRLTFTPAPGGVRRCEYTDEIEIDAGALTVPTALFTRAFFALRQARWRRLAAVLA